MIALLDAELLKLRTTRTFAAIIGIAHLRGGGLRGRRAYDRTVLRDGGCGG